MPVTRPLLLKIHRQGIVRRMIDEGRLAREPALARREAAIALRAVKHRFGADVFERCRALPPGWLNQHQTINLTSSAYGALPQLQEGRQRYKLQLSDAAPLPNAMAGYWDRGDLGDRLWGEVHDLFAAYVDLEVEIKQLRTQITGVLSSFRTVEALAEGWPEGYAHLPAEEAAPGYPALPAVRIEDLNARLEAFRRAA